MKICYTVLMYWENNMSNLKPIIEDSFIQYSGAVLQNRALIDVRDGLKPSARQIFYSMLLNKLTHDKPYKKTANAVGMAMADFYIHGDSSCEGVIMRAGQPFAMRYPLIDVKGKAGSLIESGNWAAMRYANATSLHFSFQGICPNGWHVPSDAEWSQLTSYVGSQSEFRCSVPGSITLNIAKSLASTVGWTSCTGEGDCAVGNDISANNATGFSALPAGGYYDGSSGYGAHAVFWSDTQGDGYYAYYRAFSHCSTSIDEDYTLKSRGYSVRCIKD